MALNGVIEAFKEANLRFSIAWQNHNFRSISSAGALLAAPIW